MERTDSSCAFGRGKREGQQSEARREAQSWLCPLTPAPWHHVAPESLLEQQPRKESQSSQKPGELLAGQTAGKRLLCGASLGWTGGPFLKRNEAASRRKAQN